MHLVMFDIDGTLTQTNDVDTDCFVRAVLEVLELTSIDRDWSRYVHVTDSGIVHEIIRAQLKRNPLEVEFARLKCRFVALLQEVFRANPAKCQPIAGATAMIPALAETGDVAIALATGGWQEPARLKLCTAGFCINQLAIASADDSTQRDQIMSIAKDRALQLHRRESFDSFVYVGDGLWDLQASRKLGIPFIGIAEGAQAEKLKSHGAERILPDFRDFGRFREMLQSLQSAAC